MKYVYFEMGVHFIFITMVYKVHRDDVVGIEFYTDSLGLDSQPSLEFIIVFYREIILLF